jgi:hypothetical protein
MISVILTNINCEIFKKFFFEITFGFSARDELSAKPALSLIEQAEAVQAFKPRMIIYWSAVPMWRSREFMTLDRHWRPYRNAETVVTVGNISTVLAIQTIVKIIWRQILQQYKIYKPSNEAFSRVLCEGCVPEAVLTRGWKGGQPVQITGARRSSRGSGASLCRICFCLSR